MKTMCDSYNLLNLEQTHYPQNAVWMHSEPKWHAEAPSQSKEDKQCLKDVDGLTLTKSLANF